MCRRIVILLLLAALGGCGSSGRAPLEDRYGSGQSAVSVYNVQRGDTLYSIAFRYGLDYRKVAEVNNIADPYIIYPGQNIYLWNVTSSPVVVAPLPEKPAPVAAAPVQGTVPVITDTAGSSAVIVTAVPGIAAAPVSQVSAPPTPVYQQPPPPTPGVYHPGNTSNQASASASAPTGATVAPTLPDQVSAPAPTVAAVAPTPADQVSAAAPPVAPGEVAAPVPVVAIAPAPAPTPAPAPARAAPPAKAPTPGARVTAWRWPASGPVTRGYSPSVHKGIDIAGNRGDPVYAVADGTVVYAGTGIVGFGELVIVKHNDIYISAYGHNDRLLVRENDVVGAGQIIAEKGSSGTDTVKLHFEIRKEGKPVDPVKLLPAR